MTFNVKRLLINVISLLMLLITTDVRAEFMAEFYGGEGFTGTHNAQVNLPNAEITGTHYALKFDSADTFGGRASYWFNDFQYLGLGVDISHVFGPDQKEQVSLTKLCVAGFGCSVSPETIKKLSNTVTAIGFDAMLRYPLFASETFHKGRLQPYVDIGPTIFITTIKDTGNFTPKDQSCKFKSTGLTTGAGVRLFLTQSIGVFIEYRHMNFSVDDTFYNGAVVHGITLGETLGSAKYTIQTIVAGGSWRF